MENIGHGSPEIKTSPLSRETIGEDIKNYRMSIVGCVSSIGKLLQAGEIEKISPQKLAIIASAMRMAWEAAIEAEKELDTIG